MEKGVCGFGVGGAEPIEQYWRGLGKVMKGKCLLGNSRGVFQRAPVRWAVRENKGRQSERGKQIARKRRAGSFWFHFYRKEVLKGWVADN